MTRLSQSQIDSYQTNGFLFPIPVFSPEETRALRRRLEEAESQAEFGKERAARQGLPITHAWAWDLVHDPRIVEPVSAVLGPDVLLWSMDWFIKEPGPSFVSYHQDATYWGLEPHHVASTWIALSDAGMDTGPMRFLPASHKGPVYPQDDTYEEDNLLSRGQVVEAEVDESKTVASPLKPGEMSIHHVRVIHGSDPNRTRDRRIGMVLRYCATDVRQTKAADDRAILVKGRDVHQHFAMIPRPREDCGEAERQLARRHGLTRHKALMQATASPSPGASPRPRRNKSALDIRKTDPMRVLHVYRTYFPQSQGGLEETIRQICLNTRRHAVESRVLCTSPSVRPRVVRRNEAVVYRSKRHAEVASCSISLEAFPMFRRLLPWADIVHYHFPWPFADLLHFATRVDVPTIMTYHSDIVRQRTLARLYSPVMSRFLRSVDRIVCTSPNYLATSQVLARFKEQVDIVPIGLDRASYPDPSDEDVAQVRTEYGDGFFLFIGVLRYYKCLHILLDAIRGAPYRVVIVGSGPTEAELKRQARNLQLDNVTFAGHVPDATKVALLRLSRAVVFPSYLRAEAFGVTLLEGAMNGKPLISTEVGSGTSHVNIDGETGLVVEPAAPAALRIAMDRLHGQPAMAHALGLGARRRFDRLFNGRLMGDRYADIYRSLIGAKHIDPDPGQTQGRPGSPGTPSMPRPAEPLGERPCESR